MAGLPVQITSGGLPVTITGAGAQSIPISGIGVPPGATGDQIIVTNAAGTALVAAPGMFQSILFQSHIPFILAGSGSMGNNGALTLTTALTLTYPSAYVYLPAGAIAAGVPASAGWYFCQMSSGSAGTVFNNVYTTGQPAIPGSPTAFSTTGPGAFTGVSSATNSQIFSMAANTMALRDTLRVTSRVTGTNTAAAKVATNIFGSATAANFSFTAAASLDMLIDISNRDVTNAQLITFAANGGLNTAASNFTLTTVDTTQTQTVAAQMTNATPATNNMVFESLIIELLKGS